MVKHHKILVHYTTYIKKGTKARPLDRRSSFLLYKNPTDVLIVPRKSPNLLQHCGLAQIGKIALTRSPWKPWTCWISYDWLPMPNAWSPQFSPPQTASQCLYLMCSSRNWRPSTSLSIFLWPDLNNSWICTSTSRSLWPCQPLNIMCCCLDLGTNKR